jgi:hypothetical protein
MPTVAVALGVFGRGHAKGFLKVPDKMTDAIGADAGDHFLDT